MNSLDARVREEFLTIDNACIGMRFDMLALSYAEGVYHDRFGRNANAAEIMAEMLDARMSAVMAIGYGAMRSYGEKMSFDDFAKKVCTYEHIEALREPLTRGIMQMMGVGGEKTTEGSGAGKN